MSKELEPAGPPPREEPFPLDKTLRSAVEAAVEAMPWLTDVDRGAVTLARAYAQQIDRILTDPEILEERPELITKALYLGPHLINALRELGGTPLARGATMAKTKAGDPVAEALKGFQDRVKNGERARTADAA